jgi:threonine-phosphate decarboxylase
LNRLEQFGHGGDRWTAGERFGINPADFVDFSANINPLGPPESVVHLLQEALRDSGVPLLSRYPDPDCRGLRQALAEKLDVEPEYLAVGNGGAEWIDLAAAVFQPDRVGLVIPSFAEYAAAAEKRGLPIVTTPADPQRGWQPDRRQLLQLIHRSDLVYLGHPNNPTGTLLPVALLEEAAEEAAQAGTVLVVDEAFLDFVEHGEQHSLIRRISVFPTTVLLRSMTKFYALPGLRLGFAVSHPDNIRRLRQYQIPWSVNGLAQAAGVAALKDRDFEKRTRIWLTEERSFLMQELDQLDGVEVFPGEVNYFLLKLADQPHGRLTAQWLQERMGRQGIMIRDCSTYSGLDERYVRVAVRSREENRRLVEALRRVLGRVEVERR